MRRSKIDKNMRRSRNNQRDKNKDSEDTFPIRLYGAKSWTLKVTDVEDG